MPRQRNPKRDQARELWIKSGKNRLLKDIAAELEESESRIRKWKSEDKWDNETLPISKGAKRSTTKRNAPIVSTQKVGAPKGNKNAVGNNGGAPLGNQNTLKHGGYSKIYWDTLDEEEHELIATMETDEDFQLREQIRLSTIRERRLMIAIHDKKQQKAGQSISSVTRSEDKRSFKTDEEKEQYDRIQAEKVERGDRLPGESYHITTITENTDSVISRLEQELTSVQRAKTKCIESLARLNIEREKLTLIREKDDIETEDTDDVDGVIYG